MFDRLDRRAAAAMLTVFETLGDIDRRRGRRFVEAVATLITVAPRRRQTGGAR